MLILGRTSSVLLLAGLAGCGQLMGSSTSAQRTDTVSEQPPALLAPAEPDVYRLPWTCGQTYDVTQGNHGDVCGEVGDHTGVQEYAWDFGLPLGTPVLASRAGTVTMASMASPPGSKCFDGCPYALGSTELATCCSVCIYEANRVNVTHSDGAVTAYAHFQSIVVKDGEKVAAGQLLGYSGTSGCSTGPHLHFQVMAGCPDGYCQSLPVTFDEAGIPECGDRVFSQNACS